MGRERGVQRTMPRASAPRSQGLGAARTRGRGGEWQEAEGLGGCQRAGKARRHKAAPFPPLPSPWAPFHRACVRPAVSSPRLHPRSHSRGKREGARAEAGGWTGARFGRSRRQPAVPGRSRLVLGTYPRQQRLARCSVYSTAPVYSGAGIRLPPRSPGLILSRVSRRRTEAIKHEAFPESGYTDTTPLPAHLRDVVETGKLLGHLPTRSPLYLRKVFRDKERARATEEQTSKSQG